MGGGVVEVHAADGRTWWVKRAWVPRYLTLRDRLARFYVDRPEHWYDAPIRWVVRVGRRDVVDWIPSTPDPWPLLDVPGGGPLGPDIWPAPDVAPGATVGGDFAPHATVGGDFAPHVTLGGDFAPHVTVGGDFAAGATSGGDFGPGGDFGSGGGSGGGGGDVGDVGDGAPVVLVVLLAGVALLAVAALAWFVLVPLLLVVVDGVVLLLVVLFAGLVRLLFRRPWDVVAAHERADGVLLIRRWEVRGFRRAGRVRDDVARALETGTDPDLAVTRVLVREPRDDDPQGSARSVREGD